MDEPTGAPEPAELSQDRLPVRRDYLKWSCDVLLKQLETEMTKRANNRRDVHATMLFVLVPIGLYTNGLKDMQLTTKEAGALGALAVIVVAAVYCWAKAMNVETVPAYNLADLTHFDGTAGEHDYETRWQFTRDHLLESVQRSRTTGEGLADWRRRCLVCALVSVPIAIVLFYLRMK